MYSESNLYVKKISNANPKIVISYAVPFKDAKIKSQYFLRTLAIKTSAQQFC